MNKKFNGTTIETDGVRTIAGGGTGAATAAAARTNLGLGTAATTAATDYATAAQGAKADSASQPGHTHTIADTTGLQTALDGKQAVGSAPTVHASTHATGGSDPITPAAIGAIASNITEMTGAAQVTNIVQITQAGYNAITSPDLNTIYIITP